MSLTALFAQLDLCESAADVEDVLRIAAAQGHTFEAIRKLRSEQYARIGRGIVQEALR